MGKDDASKVAIGISLTAAVASAIALARQAKAAAPGEPGPAELPEEAWDLLISMANEIEKIQIALAKIPGGEEAMPLKREQIPFTFNLAALQGVTLRQPTPFAGYIKEVTIHWPAGCNALVDVKVGHGITTLKQFCPISGFLALNDATPTYYFNEWVPKEENIMVEMRNTDAVNPHNITVTATIEGSP